MSEMIERVKAAVKAEMEADMRLPLGGWDAVYTRIARAAIEAMREPTAEVLDVHHVVPDDNNFRERALANWQDIIDAILNEGTE